MFMSKNISLQNFDRRQMLKMQIKLYIFRYLYLINGTVHCSVLKMGRKIANGKYRQKLKCKLNCTKRSTVISKNEKIVQCKIFSCASASFIVS